MRSTAVGLIAVAVIIALAFTSSVKASDEEFELSTHDESENEFEMEDAAPETTDKPAVPQSTQNIQKHADEVKRAKHKAKSSQSKAERLARMVAKRHALRRRLKQLKERKRRERARKSDPELNHMMNDVVRRMAAAASVVLPEPGSLPAPKGDGRVRSLEKKLAYFESQYSDNNDKRRKQELSAINERISKVDKAVEQLAKNAKAQSIVTRKLLEDEQRRDPLNVVIGDGPQYQPKEGLPKSFETQISRIINTVKRDAGKLYRANCGKNRPFCRVVRKVDKSEQPLPSAKPSPKKPARKPTPKPAPQKAVPSSQSYVDNGADK